MWYNYTMNLTKKQTKKFFKKIYAPSLDECWLWEGYKKPNGEAWSFINNFTSAKNIMWAIAYGNIPEYKTVYHICKNPSCVNLSHLEIETKEEKEIRIFWRKVDRKSYGKCWEWIGCVGDSGYGQGGTRNNRYSAHRFSWELHYGEIPNGLLVCHHCDNPSCVNPKHLFIGTQKDNINDMDKKGRRKPHRENPKLRGENNINSKLTEEKVLEILKLKGEKPVVEISKQYNVCYTTIYNIFKGTTWKHIIKG